MLDICLESHSAVKLIFLLSWCDNLFYVVPVSLPCSFLDKLFQLQVLLGMQWVTSLFSVCGIYVAFLSVFSALVLFMGVCLLCWTACVVCVW